MKTLKEQMFQNSRKLVLVIVIPLVIFTLIISGLLWYTLFDARAKEITAKANEYVRELEYTFEKVKSKHFFLLSELLREEYSSGYDANARDRIIKKIDEIACDTFDVAQVNFYRINTDFVIYETDYPPDTGLDFKTDPTMLEFLSSMQPGEIATNGLTLEYHTSEPRLFIYIRLPDGSWFEIGIRFTNFYERLKAISETIFTDYDANIIFIKTPTDAEKSYLSRSMETGQAIFHHTGITGAQYYISKALGFSRLNFIIDMDFPFVLELTVTLLELIALLIIFSFIIRRMLRKFSNRLSKNISIINQNVQNFHLNGLQKAPEPVDSEVEEIRAISDNFMKMREEIIGAYEETTAMNEELEASFLENQTLLEKMEVLIDVPDYVLYLNDIEKFLLRSFERLILLTGDYDFGYVAIIEDGIYKYLEFNGFDVEQMNRLQLKVEDFPITDKVKLREFGEGEFYKLHPIESLRDAIMDTQQALFIPIATKKRFYGSISLYTQKHSGNKFTGDDVRIAKYFAKYLDGYLLLKEFGEIEEELQKETINALIRLLEQHDPYTKGHSESVAHLASEFAHYLNLSEETAQDLYWSGIVHDMGKILIPHNILNKPGRLTEDEFDIIKKHPVYAYDALKDNQLMKDIAIHIRHHHEKYDGSGYPDGLKGKAIPYESRILALADSWDAMVSERIYKKGIDLKDAIADFKRNSGIQFDPDLVERWIKFIQSDMI